MNEQPETVWVTITYRDGRQEQTGAPRRGVNADGLMEYAVAIKGNAMAIADLTVDILPARSTLVLESTTTKRTNG